MFEPGPPATPLGQARVVNGRDVSKNCQYPSAEADLVLQQEESGRNGRSTRRNLDERGEGWLAGDVLREVADEDDVRIRLVSLADQRKKKVDIAEGEQRGVSTTRFRSAKPRIRIEVPTANRRAASMVLFHENVAVPGPARCPKRGTYGVSP